MKKYIYTAIFSLLMCMSFSEIKAQGTENFDNETTGATSFTENSQGFTITNGSGETTYDIEFFTAGGWDGTAPDNKFIDNSSGSPIQNDGSSFTITTTDGADISITSLYIYISTRSLATPSSTLTITGKKNGVTQYTIVKSSGFSNVETFSPNNGFTLIDFTTEGGSDNSTTKIDELIFSTTGNGDYIALDNFIYDFEIVETDPPQVLSIVVDGSPTSTATSVDFLVTFNENAINVSTDDFSIDGVGTTGTISSISGSGTTYTLTVSSISGEGTISIDLDSPNNIEDSTGNSNSPAFASGATHTVSRCFIETFESFIAGDFVFSSNGVGYTTGSANFDVEFFNNGGANNSDQFLSNYSDQGTLKTYSLSTSGSELFNVVSLNLYLSSILNGTLPTDDGSVTLRGKLGTSTLFTISKNTGFPTSASVNNGFILVDFTTDGASDYSLTNIDALEIEIGGSFQYIALDNFEHCEEVLTTDPPIVQSIKLVGNPPANSGIVNYEVIFNENAVNVSSDDFSLTQTGTAIGTISNISGSANTYNVTVSSVSGEGSIRLDLKASTNIEDDDGNTPPNPFTNGEVHLVSSCQVETFESLADGVFSWTTGGFPFTTGVSTLSVDEFISAGAGGSDRYIDNLTDQGLNKTYSIALTNTATVNMGSMEVYVSSVLNGANPTNDGTLTIVGKLDGVAVSGFSVSKSSGFPTTTGSTQGFYLWDFATEGGADWSTTFIDEIELTIGGSFQYIAVDNFKFCLETIPPVASCQNYTAQLDNSGNVSISVANINNGSTDNVGITSMTVSPNTFTCADIGNNIVTLTVSDAAGNIDTCTATVTVVDNIKPTVNVQNVTIYLDANGDAPTNVAAVDNGSLDNCGIATMTLDTTDFTCNDVGNNVVTLTVTDVNNNVETATATVVVVDNINPNAITQNINTYLDGAGNSSIVASDIDNGSSDNCGSVSLSASQTAFTCADIGPNNVTLTADDGNGNTDFRVAVVTVLDTISPIAVTQNITTYLDGAGNSSIVASDIDNGSSDNCGSVSLSASQTAFTCADIGPNNVTLTANDGNGNTDFRVAVVTVLDTISPIAVTQNITTYLDGAGNSSIVASDIDNGSSDNCGSVSLSASQTAFTCADIGPNNVTLTTDDGNGNTDFRVAVVTVLDTISPIAVTQNITTYLDGAGNSSIVASDIDNGSSDNCSSVSLSASQTAFTCADIGPNNVTLTADDGNGNTDFRTAVVTVLDTISPTLSIKNITLNLDSGGNASILANDLVLFSADNCGTANTSASKTSFTCADVGPQNVTVTADDGNGNTSLKTAIVTVVDNIKPTVNVQNVTIYLDANGDASTNVAAVDNGSLDNCGIATMTLDTTDFDCSDVGDHTVTLTATDVNNNVETATATVSVVDNIKPTVNVQNVTIYLDANGTASTNVAAVDNGSLDNCGIATMTLDTTDFTCNEVGNNIVTLTVTDVNNNVETATATVSVVDNIKPTVNVQNVTIYLDANGDASTNVAAIDNGSLDNCGIATMTLDTTDFTCTDVGNNVVTLTVIDVNNNIETATATVSVVDNIKPTVNVQNVTIYLDANGDASTNVAAIDNGSLDNCGIATMTLDTTDFTCTDVGNNVVTLTVIDVNNNIETATATVSVVDNIKPTVNVQNVTIYLDANGDASTNVAAVDNGSLDNCGIATMTLDTTDFTCNEVGNNVVTLTVTDVNSNVETATATVSVVDNLPPTVVTQNISLTLDANGNASTTFSAIENGSSDNCGIASTSLNITDFTCANVGQNTVILTVTDVNGNSATNTAIVTIIDNTPPVVLTKDINVQLDENGTANIIASNIDNGSSDVCGIASLVLDKLSFDCTNVGENIVTLTVTDNSGNSAFKTAIVTVEDSIKPTVVVQNITVELDADGTASIVVEDIDNGSLDNCGIETMVLDVTSFDCTSVGENTVTLSVTDVNMNVSTATATVTVVDLINPIVVTQDITLELDETGTASITIADIDNGSSDNCEIATMTLDVTTFDCDNIGENTVTLSVTDASMNVSTATATVTVVDLIAPTVITQNITVELDETGTASITVADIDNGSLDNCEIESMVLDVTSFDCDSVGDNVVTLTVTDVNGKTSSAEAIVTVVDLIAPTVLVRHLQSQMDENELVSITAADIDNGSFDNCEIASMELDITTFDCTDIGENIVILTVTDVNGNTSSAEATVTVVDLVAPTVTVNNITVDLDESGAASITVADIDNGSFDNCEIATMTLDMTTFDCSSVGKNNVTLTVTDVNGNSATSVAVVTVVDTVMPIANSVAPFTVSLDETGTASISVEDIDNGSTDNCGIEAMTIDVTSFDCSFVGENTITLTVTDGSGNSATSTTVVTVVDTTAPIVVTQNISVALDEFGNVTIEASDINDDSFDACGIASMSLDQTSFSCPTLGDHTVTLTVTDANGNSASEMAIVTFTSDDLDNDLIADVCDDDLDGDGVDNDTDNCPTTANSDQRDLDRNGIGDICDEGNLEIPKGFSPNGDGANDEFIILGLHKYPNNSIQVYNRYGNIVYESKNYQNYWDGIGNKKERRLPAAPYFYVLSIDGGTRIVKGWVYINY